MLDPKTVAEAMEVIKDEIRYVYEKTCLDGCEYDVGEIACKLGYLSGVALSVHMLCEAESRPKTREVSGE